MTNVLVTFYLFVHIKYTGTQKIRLDVFLSQQLKQDFSRVEIQNLIKNSAVKVDNTIITKPSFLIANGNAVDIFLDEIIHLKNEAKNIKPMQMQINIVFENENLLIIDKPVGLVVHPGAGTKNNTLMNGLMALQESGVITLSNVRGDERLGIVHRLDKDTCGLMIIAKNNKEHRLLSEMLKTHEIDRRYLALIHGVPVPPVGKIENYICRDKKYIQKMKLCSAYDDSAKNAITNYKVIKVLQDSKISLIECKLETGRTHQIRLHMQSIKHPLVGEQIYTNSNFRNDDTKKGYTHQMLQSYKLNFNDPMNGEKIFVELPNVLC